jgi:hypothetical protein
MAIIARIAGDLFTTAFIRNGVFRNFPEDGGALMSRVEVFYV